MEFSERKVIDQLEVLRDGTVQVREATEVLRGEEVIAREYYRFVINIEDEEPDFTRLDADSLAIVKAARTASRLSDAKTRREARETETP